jgi:hypothetical protein
MAELVNGIRAKANALITEVNNVTGLDATLKTQLLAKLNTIKTTGESGSTIGESLGITAEASKLMMQNITQRVTANPSFTNEATLAGWMYNIFTTAIIDKMQNNFSNFTTGYDAINGINSTIGALLGNDASNRNNAIQGSRTYFENKLVSLGASEELAGWIMQLCEDTQEAGDTFSNGRSRDTLAGGQFNITENNEVASAPQEQGVRLAHVNPAMFPTIRKETV